MLGASEGDRALRMERRTWAVVWLAFALWLTLTVFGGGWVVSFVRSAVAPAPSTLEGVSGVVLFREADQRSEASAQEGLQLFEGDELATSFGSRAVVRILDGSVAELYPNTRLRVEAARIGRFNPAATRAGLGLASGTVRLSVPDARATADRLQVTLPQGAVTFSPGEYTMRVRPDVTRVSVWSGKALLQADASQWVAADGQKLVVSAAGGREVVDLLENLVGNGDFRARFQAWEPWEDREQGRPDVRGQLEIVTSQGVGAPSHALRVWRNSAIDAHNETGLRQRLDRDVVGARALRLEARVRVDVASLSGGGYLGSEYPMMIRVRLRDARGGDLVWTQGFYYGNAENRPVPIGLQVPRGEWVDFSVDLSQVVTQPSSVESIEIFGAGHTFDALIADVRVLVD